MVYYNVAFWSLMSMGYMQPSPIFSQGNPAGWEGVLDSNRRAGCSSYFLGVKMWRRQSYRGTL